MPSDPLFYLVGLPAAFLIALGKGAFGGGLAVLGIPLFALVVDPVVAAIMVAPLVSAMDIFALQAFPPRTWSWPDMGWIVPGLLIGIAAGAFFFVMLDGRIVALAIAVVTLWVTGRYFWREHARRKAAVPISPIVAMASGLVSGFTTFVAHAGGPPLAMYLLRRGLPKSVYAGTMVALFTLGNTVKLFPYLWLGTRRPEALWAAAALLPAIPLGVWAGKALHDRLDERQLYFWCYLLVAMAGLKLLFDSLRALVA